MHLLFAGRTCRVGCSSRDGGEPHRGGPSAPGPCAVSIRRISKPGAQPDPGPGEKDGAQWREGEMAPRERAGGGVRRGGSSPGIYGAFAQRPCWPRWGEKKSAPCRRWKIEKDAGEHLFPRALAEFATRAGQGTQSRAVVRKQLVCEKTPECRIPARPEQSKFGPKELGGSILASNWPGSLAACSASQTVNRFPVHGDNTSVGGVARPLGGGGALYFTLLLVFSDFDSFVLTLCTQLAAA
ncbi:uncharacterized protein Tco025E_07574 [Trypanosoma conorhini]|uniref:Uncharacterized protein n=1 Tax=Trypanosoma conorhini TaxID=83891 RepID=A0A422NNW3_9TRYP|nr:uncharacterized protein Tco025E_07574 [Trypanosoma conorhini]RNF07104.1 hypothetical protein Tco025E_07574 [Trypanosoma conorhini]